MANAAMPAPDRTPGRFARVDPHAFAPPRGFTVLVLIAALFTSLTAVAATSAGKVTYVRGIATAQGSDGTARVIATNAPLYEGDVVRTAARSYAVLQLDDDSRLTLRPDTVFQVEAFEQDSAAGGNVLLRLFKGGMRTITGLIGKRNPKGYRLRSATATIGIRGTDFEARLCEDDCASEAKGSRRSKAKATRVIGRVAFVSGQASAAGRNGQSRTLTLGGSLFEGDVLETGTRSVAVLVFRDESRVTLRAGSTLRVDEYAYDKDDPDKSSFAMNFLRGGIRMVSGLIAKLRPKRVRLDTPVATIAVRGTGFELKCEEQCSAKGQARAEPGLLDLLVPPAHAQGVAGMTAFVFDGAIEFRLPNGTLTIDQGKAVFFDGLNPPRTLPGIPAYFQQVSAAQGQLDRDTDQSVVDSATRAPTQQETAEPGLYVRVIEGDVAVTDNQTGSTTLAGPGQTVLANPRTGDIYQITAPPGTLPPITPSGDILAPGNAPQASPLPATEEEPQSEFECVVQ